MSALKFIQNSIKVLDTVLSEREKNRKNKKKSKQIGKEEIKLILFAHNMGVYVET